jgi:DNA-binding NtrC family response regulator
LNVISINLPSLRERREDIPFLVAHFLRDKLSSRTRRPFQITKAAMELLMAHDWPGNVRELENAVERATALCESDTIQPADLPPAVLAHLQTASAADSGLAALPVAPTASLFPLTTASDTTTPAMPQPVKLLKNFLREQEAAHIQRALEEAKGDKEQAAILLGISLATLYRKMAGED